MIKQCWSLVLKLTPCWTLICLEDGGGTSEGGANTWLRIVRLGLRHATVFYIIMPLLSCTYFCWTIMTECFEHYKGSSQVQWNSTVILYLPPPPSSPQGCRKEEGLPARISTKCFSVNVHSCPKQVNNCCCWPRRAWRPSTFSLWCSSPPSRPPAERERVHHLLPWCFASDLMEVLVTCQSSRSKAEWACSSAPWHTLFALGGHVACCTQLSAQGKDKPPLRSKITVICDLVSALSDWTETNCRCTCCLKYHPAHLAGEQRIVFELR